MVEVPLEDLRAVLQAVDYMENRSLIGPVDRLGDIVALATMRREESRG
jgi:ribosomal protein S28E/S33